MQNSDSGTKLNPGDRVRVRHDPKRDDSLQARHADRRAAFNGKVVRVETIERDGDVLVSEGTDEGAWFNPAELSPIVTDADGHEVGAPAAPLADRPVPELRAAILASVDALEAKLATANAEAQGWHSAALLARGEVEHAWAHVRSVEAGLDALRGKLGAAEAKLVQTTTERRGWRNEALREQGERKAAEERLAAVAQAWGTLRAWMLALPRPLGAAGIEGVDAVDKALGGVVVAEQKAKVAGPWTRGPVMGVWYRVDRTRTEDDVARVYAEPAAYDVPSGWYVYDGPRVMRSGPEMGDAGKAAADRALLAAGWTLENETGGTGDTTRPPFT